MEDLDDYEYLQDLFEINKSPFIIELDNINENNN